MAGFNEIDRVRTPKGQYVSASPLGGSGRPKRAIDAVPVPLVLVVVALLGYGLLVVWSAIQTNENYSFSRQLMGVAMGVVAMLICYSFDYRRLANYTTLLLIVNVVLILSPHLPVIGVESKGAQSWVKIGIQLQPGEFAKITVILLDAAVMSKFGGRLDDPREFIRALAYIAIPFLCIMTQPDLGTGLVYLCIAAFALVMGGANTKYLLITLGLFVAAVVAVFAIDEVIKSSTGEYKLLKQYQRNRLLVFMDQSGTATTDEGYNLQQAKVAIGSGGLFGKGLFQGTQHSLGLLPEAPTDFIFCVLAEELGFLGALVLLGLYIALVLISFRIARSSGDLFGMVIVMCVVGMWLFQILENIGMDCGLMPITGIPLPFMSYGSSFMVVNFVMLGMIGSVWSHNATLKQH